MGEENQEIIFFRYHAANRSNPSSLVNYLMATHSKESLLNFVVSYSYILRKFGIKVRLLSSYLAKTVVLHSHSLAAKEIKYIRHIFSIKNVRR